MNIHILILAGFSIVKIVGANIDSHFAVDPEEIQLKEIADNVRTVSGAVMGLTEYMMEIRDELKTLRADISASSTVSTPNVTLRPLTYYSGRPIRDPEDIRRQSLELADKVERLLAMDQSPEVDLAKEELRRTVEKNFLRMLAAILVTGPTHTQERSDDIFKLMRSVLNGELDFTPVVQRLPLILRDSETNQFVNLLITLRESERGGGSFRQELFSSIENSAHVMGNGRQILPNFPIPSSPGLTNNAQNNPAYVHNFQNNYQQQSGNINNNRIVPNNNNIINTNNGILPNNNNVNNNNNINNNSNNLNNLNNNNNGQLAGNENANAQGQAPTRNQLPTINSLIDAMTQTNQLIKEIPSLVEGLQTMIESLEGLFG